MIKKILFFAFGAVVIAGAFYFTQARSTKGKSEVVEENFKVITDLIKATEILDGEVYGQVMEKAGVPAATVQKIYDAAKSEYDLAAIKAGKKIELVYDFKTAELKKFVYKINSEDELVVDINADWKVEVRKILYVVKIKEVKGQVNTSMYAAALDNGIDERAIIDLADAFQWTIDFALDPRIGDTFSMIYEERYLEGQYIMPGRILAGRYVNEGQPFDLYYFKESEDNQGYFDQNGNSARKIFLKAPVQFKYITSGFTTGLRYISAFNTATGHRAIDYAAATGTPIRAVGDGTVTFAGWSPAGYGYLTSIRHNDTYSTNYAHQSRIIVKSGQKVKQGQIIGYVGSTGFSTGPHLHFEMLKNGAKINPLKEILPPGKALVEGSRAQFLDIVKKYQNKL